MLFATVLAAAVSLPHPHEPAAAPKPSHDIVERVERAEVSGLQVAMSNVSSHVAMCPEGSPECELNLHLVHWVVPKNATSTGISTRATATYVYPDGRKSSAVPLHTRLEYVLHDTTTERYELPENSPLSPGLIAHQWLARLDAKVPQGMVPKAVCIEIQASDATTGETGVKLLDGNGTACLDVKVIKVPLPQRQALGAFIDHPAMTYTCPTTVASEVTKAGKKAAAVTAEAGAPCLAFGHVVLSVYPTDPTHPVYGGGAFARRSADGHSLDAPLSSRGVRFEYQAKPTTGRGAFAGMMGPRVLIAVQLLVHRHEELGRDMCFTLWAADGLSGEVVDVTGYDASNPHGPPYPPPDEKGVFCFTPVQVGS